MCVSQSVMFCLSPYTEDIYPDHGLGGQGGLGGQKKNSTENKFPLKTSAKNTQRKKDNFPSSKL